MSSLAAQYGFADWRDIYLHPDNAKLRGKRPDPNVLSSGDLVVIPDRAEKAVACATGGTHRFRVKRPQAMLKVRIGDGSGGVLEGKRYTLTIGRAAPIEGTIPSGGVIEHPVTPGETDAMLRIWVHDDAREAGLVYPLRIGHLDPHDEISGVRHRLHNLGYCVSHDGELDERTRGALRAFQKKHGLRESGEPDEATTAKLRGVHEGA